MPDRIRTAQARVLAPGEMAVAKAICQFDPVDSVMAAARIDIAYRRGLHAAGGEVWGWPARGPIQAVCWVGANMVPVVPRRLPPQARLEAAAGLAELAVRRRRTSSSIAGERTVVLEMWRHLEAFWPRARDVRGDQPSFALRETPSIPPDPLVRRTQLADLDAILPAGISMFAEEVGFSPVQAGEAIFRDQLRRLVQTGCSFMRATSEIEFKAEIGVIAGGVGQVQGVWIPPHLRGRGLSAPAIAAVVLAAQKTLAPTISLYANVQNERALRCYRRVGFEQVGTFATILF